MNIFIVGLFVIAFGIVLMLILSSLLGEKVNPISFPLSTSKIYIARNGLRVRLTKTVNGGFVGTAYSVISGRSVLHSLHYTRFGNYQYDGVQHELDLIAEEVE
jgi:hypothetical protein